MGTGAVIGITAALLFVALRPPEGGYPLPTVLGYLGVVGAMLGALAGGAVAVVVETLIRRGSGHSQG